MQFLRTLIAISILSLSLVSCGGGGGEPLPVPSVVCMTPLFDQGTGFFLALPTAFTPNGDGKNDRFRIVSSGLNPAAYELDIYNSNGIRVFHTNNITASWDGTDKNGNLSNTYFHSIKIKYRNSLNQVAHFCTYLYLVPGSGCINPVQKDIDKYFFEDQFDPATGLHPYATGETFCP